MLYNFLDIDDPKYKDKFPYQKDLKCDMELDFHAFHNTSIYASRIYSSSKFHFYC